jgi:hypothetical protein
MKKAFNTSKKHQGKVMADNERENHLSKMVFSSQTKWE